MSDRTITLLIGFAVVSVCALFVGLYYHKADDGERRCATIGAVWIDGSRGPSMCAKPDGSLWRLP